MYHKPCFALLVVALAVAAGAAHAQDQRYGFGHALSDAEIAGWNIDVRPDGIGLPAGRGEVAQGRAVYAQRCASCHGEDLKGAMGALVGGKGTLGTDKPLRTVGSYWPYATTLYDFVHRAMPFDAPQSLTPDEVYAVSAYILFENQIIGENDVMNATTLPQVAMPNRNGFYGPDPRPDVFNVPCRTDCKQAAPRREVERATGTGASGAPTTGVGGGGSPQ